MEFEKLISDFAEAAGLELKPDRDGIFWCDADGVPIAVRNRAKTGEAVVSAFPFGEMRADEPTMRHALELSAEGAGTGGFFLGMRDGIFLLSGVFSLDRLDAEALGLRMLELAAASRRVAQSVGSSVADECVEQACSAGHGEDLCNQSALRV